MLCALAVLSAPPAAAGEADGTCDTALLLAIDVSNSVDESEYRLQIDGLADALNDPDVSDALVVAQAAVAVLLWSGPREQLAAIPWQQVAEPSDARLLSTRVRALPRPYVRSGTAPAEALLAALDLLAQAPPCGRHVVDVSGDGARNMGGPVARARDDAVAQGVTVNAIAIETVGHGVADFFRDELVTPGGFVMSARGHRDYPRAIREKILRELATPTG
ncbi:hypothetical protein Rumeso_00596 [Rubellimicrobium mesophilum DSM 19309]|uniref:VWFA domain-containing protein n=1 Tax=Rubellimicrobium mesophilum DSM 19309 TaxID=442562 RepID=A0A017HVT5_9RHOB|nr:hypothetical protein Rumeso_00596 [Rubellimicrobium mesophilum DSM 19309]